MKTINETLCLLRMDRQRTNYTRWRYLYDPVMAQILCFRLADCGNKVVRTLAKFGLSFWSYVTGIQLTAGTQMGGGIKIVHRGNIVITGRSVIGENLTIHQCVTIGKSFGGSKYGSPQIGNNVIIYPNSVVVGNISVGNNVVIGAGSVVVSSVPDNCVVAGNPAKVITRDSKRVILEKELNLYYHINW